MSEMLSRLHAVRPLAEEVRRVSGAVGVSIGILHGAKILFTDHFGFRDVKNRIVPDDDTIYYLASLSKSFTASGIGHLINQNEDLSWDTPIGSAYKPLSHEDAEIRENVTIADCLSHRTGLAPKNHIWSQEFAHFTLKRGEDIRTFTYLEKIAALRDHWIYNNWGYGAADELIEHRSGTSWGHFLKDNVFDVIGMNRTFTTREQYDENFAKPYMALASGEPWEVEDPDGEDGEILEGALAVRSCTKDLLKYYIAFLQALKKPSNERVHADKQPFIDPQRMVQPHVKLSTKRRDLPGAYGLGWISTSLPGPLGANGMNYEYLGRMPTVGKGLPHPTTCYYHQGSANSFLSSVHLLPELDSGVVVLTNSMAQNDVADWLGELYIETILDNSKKNDYVQLARNSAKASMALWPGMRTELEARQVPNTRHLPVEKYVGIYYNRIKNFKIEITENAGKLFMRFQNEKKFAYELTHYHYHTFSWLITHDQDVKLGRFPITRASFYLIEFEVSTQAKVESLIWIHDDQVLTGERFSKIIATSSLDSATFIEADAKPSTEASVESLAEQLDGRVRLTAPDSGAENVAAVVLTEGQDKSVQNANSYKRNGLGHL